MSSELPTRLTLSRLARELGTSPQTLRRAIRVGLIKSCRLHCGGFELSTEELAYLRGHWSLLAGLRVALRSERRVRLAVLYGSRARGDDDPASDVDLAVLMSETSTVAVTRLQIRLRDKLELPIDAHSLNLRQGAPSFLAPVLEDGRVLLDRDHAWTRLVARRDEIAELAAEEYEALMRSAAAALCALSQLHEDARGAPGRGS
jgi:predicted nucleotidyltransferase